MISTAARCANLVARHRLDRSATSVDEAVEDLVALHSSDPITPHLAALARVRDYAVEDLENAFDRSRLWRLHAMRRTLWVAPADRVGMLQASVGDAVAAKERRRLEGWAEGLDLAALEESVLAAIAAEPGVHTRELTTRIPALQAKVRVGSGKWAQEAPVGSRLLYVLAMEAKLRRTRSSGTWKSSQYGWATATVVRPARAAEELIRRYLERFGPATRTDVRWWTGLTAAQVDGALSEVAEEVRLETGAAWVARGFGLQAASGVALLPGLDPTPMGWKERDWFLGDHGAALFDRNGNVGPTIWVEGRIVGGWAVSGEGRVLTKLLEDVGDVAEAAVAAEAERLGAWLGGTSATPRFRTPLEKSLV